MALFDLNLPDGIVRILHQLQQDVADIAGSVREIAFLLRLAVVGIPAERIRITQIGGKKNMITGVPLGGAGTFAVTPIPPNGKLQTGSVPQWTTGDTSVTLTPAADGLSCVANVAAGETLPSFGLTCTATSSDGTPLTATVSVPILAAVVVPATALSIDQIA